MPGRVAARAQEPGPLEVIAELYKSGFVDGLVGRLNRGWSLLDGGDVEDVVVDATLALYAALVEGRRVRSPEA